MGHRSLFLYALCLFSSLAFSRELDFYIPTPSSLGFSVSKLDEKTLFSELNYRFGFKHGGYLGVSGNTMRVDDPDYAQFTERGVTLSYGSDPIQDWSMNLQVGRSSVVDDYIKSFLEGSISYFNHYVSPSLLLSFAQRRLQIDSSLSTDTTIPLILSNGATLALDLTIVQPWIMTLSFTKNTNEYRSFTSDTSQVLTTISYAEYTGLISQAQMARVGYRFSKFSCQLVYSKQKSAFDDSEINNLSSSFQFEFFRRYFLSLNYASIDTVGVSFNYDWY